MDCNVKAINELNNRQKLVQPELVHFFSVSLRIGVVQESQTGPEHLPPYI